MQTTGPLDMFRETFAGELTLPGDPRYDVARGVFNAMIDRRPALIARCATTADVAAAVRFARETGLVVAVRSGGHSVAGLALSGGVSHQRRRDGMTVDNLVSAEVVLADGSVVTANADENADLFWGIRGGGGNFGIVTEFEFRLHELGPIVMAGLALWPLERAPEVVRAWRDFADAAPDEVSTACVVVTAPPEEFVPDDLKGRPALGMAAMYVGDPEEGGAAALQPVKALRPAVDLIGPMPYTAFQASLDVTAPPGLRSYWRGEYLRSLSDDAIDAFLRDGVALVETAPPFSQAVIFRIGQAVNAVPGDATAFSLRDANYLFHPIVAWSDPTDDARLIDAGRGFAEAMRRFGTGGAYLNFTPEDNRVRDAYNRRTYESLVALKNTYDPENLFRLNQNIRPTTQAGRAVVAG